MKPAAKPQNQDGYRKYVLPAIAVAVLLAGAFGIYRLVTGESPRKRVLETVAIKLVPPPPPEVKPPPPEPPKMVEEQKIEPPVDKPMDAPKDEPPPGPLALDAKGEAGNDAFGLGGKLGGADFMGGGGGTRWGHYSNLVINSVSKSIRDDEKLNNDKFRATIKVWVSDTGKVLRVQVLRSTGDAGTTARMEQVISAMPALPEAPSKDMPQPIIVRIGAQAGLG